MSELAEKIFKSIMTILIVIAMFAVGFVVGETVGYKDGQVKTLSGKIEYKLVTNPDSTRVWEYMQKEEE